MKRDLNRTTLNKFGLKFFLCIVLLSTQALKSQHKSWVKEDVISYMQKVVDSLASPVFSGRLAGTEGDILARSFILRELKSLNLQNFSQDFITYLREVQVVKTANITLWLGDSNSVRHVLLMAHYDHIGKGEIKSRSYFIHEVHPGADDNASGVALLLALTHYLVYYQIFSKYSISFLIAFTSGHEDNLWGAKKLLAQIQQNNPQFDLVINLDMVGRYRQELVIWNRSSLSDSLIKSLSSCQIRFSKNEMFLSDVSIFGNASFPVLHISTGWHEDYHRISDTPDKINYEGMFLIYDFLLKLIDYLSKN